MALQACRPATSHGGCHYRGIRAGRATQTQSSSSHSRTGAPAARRVWGAAVRGADGGAAAAQTPSETVRSLHLGELHGPVLVFGGPYRLEGRSARAGLTSVSRVRTAGTCLSNLEAMAAVLQEAERRRVPLSHVICTGDVVAYCADPQQTVDLVRSAGIAVLQGNCEESLGARSADCGCGFDEGSACSQLSVAWYGYSDARLDEDSRKWMHHLPTSITFHLGPAACSVIHGGATDVSRFVFASSPQSDKASEVAALPPVPLQQPHDAAGGAAGSGSRPPDVVIAGHSGIPFSQQLPDGTLWHNAGVVGMPANDGTARVWCSLLEATADTLEVTHVPLEYDFACTARKMRMAALPVGYADALASGLWPSLDVLPPVEAAATGEALRADALSMSIPWAQLRAQR